MMIRPNQIFPLILIILQFGACIGYACTKDWRLSTYWLAAAVLNIAVTF